MSSSAYVAFAKGKNEIVSVLVQNDGEIDALGINLIEYFSTKTEVKKLVKGTINHVDEDEVIFEDLSEFAQFHYESKDEFFEDMTSNTYYYLYENDTWYISKPNQCDFQELESVIEEEF